MEEDRQCIGTACHRLSGRGPQRGQVKLSTLRAPAGAFALPDQEPMRPPSILRTTTVAGRGRRGLLAVPYGQLLTVDGLVGLGVPNWLFQ